MIKKILFVMFTIFTISFGEINDSNNYLKESEREKIEARIKEIEKKHNIVYYINLGRSINEEDIVEKTIILDIIPDGKSGINVKLKITQDIDTSDFEEEMENLLIQGEEAILGKKYDLFINEVLEVSDKVLEELEVEKKEMIDGEREKSIFSSKLVVITVLLLIFIAIFTIFKLMKLGGARKRKRYY